MVGHLLMILNTAHFAKKAASHSNKNHQKDNDEN